MTGASELIHQARAKVAEVKRWVDNDVAAGDAAIQIHADALESAIGKLDTAAAIVSRVRIAGEVSREALAAARAEYEELRLRVALKELVEQGVLYSGLAEQLERWIFDGADAGEGLDVERVYRDIQEVAAAVQTVIGWAAQRRAERNRTA